MRMIDIKCSACDAVHVDYLQRDVDASLPMCEQCGQPTERVHLGKPASVIDDSIPGGLEIKNGLCEKDGTPRKFYSKSDIARAAKEAGWTSYVEHIGAKGSDKSKFTSRWV